MRYVPLVALVAAGFTMGVLAGLAAPRPVTTAIAAVPVPTSSPTLAELQRECTLKAQTNDALYACLQASQGKVFESSGTGSRWISPTSTPNPWIPRVIYPGLPATPRAKSP